MSCRSCSTARRSGSPRLKLSARKTVDETMQKNEMTRRIARAKMKMSAQTKTKTAIATSREIASAGTSAGYG